MDKKLISIFALVVAVLSLIILVVGSNSYWMMKVNRIEIEQAKEYAEKLEFQRELTKSSIQTVTQETNHYMYINEQIQGENDALQNKLDTLLKADECANSRIPDDVRKQLFTK